MFRRTVTQRQKEDQKSFVECISKNEDHMQGMIYVNDYHAQQVKKKEAGGDPVMDYVKNFSELHDVIDTSKVQDQTAIFGLAKMLKQNVQTN